jgi:hypothetical protein
MKAELLYRYREDLDEGAIIEVVVWRVPTPVPGSTHAFKYRLFYGFSGHRVIGYDNESEKGDHRHFEDREESYMFTSPEQLFDDFLADVNAVRRK